jgi:hypothetical protein
MENNSTTQLTEAKKKSFMRSEVINLARYEATSSVEKEDKKGWVSYGEDNNYPKYLIDLYETSPVHNALCNSIAEMIVGKGLGGDVKALQTLKSWGITDEKLLLTASDDKFKEGHYFRGHIDT